MPCFPESLLTLNPLNLLKLVTVQNIIIRPQAGSCGGAAEEDQGCCDDAAALLLKLAAILVAGMVGVAIPLAAEEEEGCRDDAPALRLKLAAMAAILVSGMVGVAIPLAAGRKRRRLLSTESGFFALAKAFAAGVILATGFIHMLHDAEAALTDPCLPASPGAASPSPASSPWPPPSPPSRPSSSTSSPHSSTSAAKDDEERSIITAAPEPPVDEDEDEGSAKGGNAVHIVGMSTHAAVHGHSHYQGYIR
uniref:Uncharacterized protein n=1 Tax=Ananas comosus var. bracteatus TaxID=296719 RepID=A0A6V7PA71_ANACO|nr:unnamed protein product [Ananas comosus var. bracteatus]